MKEHSSFLRHASTMVLCISPLGKRASSFGSENNYTLHSVAFTCTEVMPPSVKLTVTKAAPFPLKSKDLEKPEGETLLNISAPM